MSINSQFSLHKVVLSLSDAMDCAYPVIARHQARVAYISTNIAKRMGYSRQDLFDVFVAGALHDIGLIRPENRVAIVTGRLEGFFWHGEAGYRLLKDLDLFVNAANLIRYHHVPWVRGTETQHDGRPLPIGSQIILLGDEVDRALQRNVGVLQQCESVKDHIRALAGRQIHPDCIEAFMSLAGIESFWLDCVSNRIYTILMQQIDWPTLMIDDAVIQSIAKVFAHLIDAQSPWTSTHSVGVTATAVALAGIMNFSLREQTQMRTAGYLHDLGMLTIPTSILDKPGKLTDDEMLCIKQHTYHTYRILNEIEGMSQIAELAAFHHERLDGNGYPFHYTRRELNLGSRIMAVADMFTALMEDRPYRKGMSKEEALSVIDNGVQNGGIDGQVVSALRGNFEEINLLRSAEQLECMTKRQQLTESFPYLINAAKINFN
jgi:HD-GYP domain-containing protein (c-di-GMP phosphodiesterase class II)